MNFHYPLSDENFLKMNFLIRRQAVPETLQKFPEEANSRQYSIRIFHFSGKQGKKCQNPII
jgi:hypothetical protein